MKRAAVWLLYAWLLLACIEARWVFGVVFLVLWIVAGFLRPLVTKRLVKR